MKSICFSLTKRVLGLTLISWIVLLLASPVYAEWASVGPPSVSSDWGVWGVNFTSPNEGWAVGADFINHKGVLLHYSGGTWTSVNPPSVSPGWVLDGVHFTSPNEGWAVGFGGNEYGILLHYSGGTWTSVSPPSVSSNWELIGGHFTSANEGWAVGLNYYNRPTNWDSMGVLLHYSGGTWTSVNPPAVSSNWNVWGVHFTSSNEGWAVGPDRTNQRGVLLHYSGGTWTSVSPPPVSSNWGLIQLYFTSSDEGWAVGRDSANQRGVLLHYSGGAWTSVSPPAVSSSWYLNGVHFTSPEEGWTVGEDDANGRGVLLYYSGGTWTSVIPPSVSSNWRLMRVHFISPNEGWAGGYDFANKQGVLLHFESSPISPDQGTTGTEFTITGSGFGSIRGKVLVGTVAPKILEWTDSSIRCQLSKLPSLGTYDVTIQPKGASPILVQDGFSIVAPEIISVEPSSGSPNDQITVNGFFFGTKKGKVTLGGKNCKVVNWMMAPATGDSEIQFVVPKGLASGTHELRVINGVGFDAVEFTVD